MRIKKYQIRKVLTAIGIVLLFLYPLPKLLGYTPIAMRIFVNILRNGTVDDVRFYMDIFHVDPNMSFPDSIFPEGVYIMDGSRNPLNIALENRNLDVIEFLVERGALIDNKRSHINAISFIRYSELCSNLYRQILMMDLAEKYGQNPDYTPVLDCFKYQHFTNYPEFNNYLERVGNSLVANAESMRFGLTAYNTNVISLNMLLDYDFLLCEPGQYNLVQAAFYSDPESIKILLEAGCDPNEYAVSAKTSPLGYAIAHNRDLEVAHVLLEAGADPNRNELFTRNPLYYLDLKYRLWKYPSKDSEWAERRQLLLDYGAREYLSEQELLELFEL